VQATAATVAANVWPAMVAVSACGVVAAFADAVTVTLPFPDPEVGETDNAAFVVDAVHEDGAHPAGVADTLTVCEPPLDVKLVAEGEIANAHALLTGEGWFIVDEEPLHAISVTAIREAANEHASFMRPLCYAHGIVRSAYRRSLQLDESARPSSRLIAPSPAPSKGAGAKRGLWRQNTVIVMVAVAPAHVAMTSASPLSTAVTRPSGVTDAISIFELTQIERVPG